jgi:DNA repair photolyase
MITKEIYRKTILNKAKFPANTYTANPYVGCPHACRYCYAMYMSQWTGHTEPWGTFLDVKKWPNLTDKQLEKLEGCDIQIGTVCDPYNPMEAQFQRTRHLLEELTKVNCHVTIITKSSLVLRDMDLLRLFRDPLICFSIFTLDEKEKASMETSDTVEARLKAMETLYSEGMKTGCFLAPVFPVLTKIPPIIERVRNICHYIMIERLQLRGKERENIMKWIGASHPELWTLYDSIYHSHDLSYWKNYRNFYRDQFQKLGYKFTDNDSMMQDGYSEGKPVIINWLYREFMDENPRRVEFQ